MKNTKLKMIAISLLAAIAASTAAGCGCANTASPDEATESTAIFASAPAATTALDAAIADEGLTVNEDGEIVDEKGNKVKTNEDGKIEVKTADGETIEVDAKDIKASNEVVEENKAYEEAQKKSSNSSGSNNNSSTSKSTTTSSKASAANTGSSSTSKTGTSSKSSGSTSSSTSKSNTTSSSTTSSKTGGSTTSKTNSNTSTSSSAQSSASSSKTYHEAIYKYIEHPAETKQVWVVDKEAYTYEEPIYETQERSICNDCGADLTDMSSADRRHHCDAHIDEGGKGSYRGEYMKVQVGTKTVEVPEEGHYETVVVKEAWTEKVLVKEAGWY